MEVANGEKVEKQKIFVGGLSWDTTNEGLRAYFEAYGEVTDTVVMVDNVTKKPRGFGFVTFKDATSVHGVLKGTHHVIDNKKVDPKPAQVKFTTDPQGGPSGGGPEKQKKIFVGGVEPNTTEDQMKEFFSQYGPVISVDLKKDKTTDRIRGFGFVEFQDDETVDRVIQIHFHQINGKMVECKVAEPRNAAQGGGAPGGVGGFKSTGGYGGGGAAYQQAPTTVGGANYQGGNRGGGGGGGYVPYPQYGYQSYQQQQQAYNNYYFQQAAASQYGSGTERYPAGQQAAASVPNQQMSSYGQETSAYPNQRTAYTASDAYAGQGNFSYENSQVVSQTTGYPQYGDTQASSNFGRQGQQQSQQQQRYNY